MRASLISGMESNPETNPIISFNIRAAEISPFLFVNLMVLLICFLIFYLFYASLKSIEFWIHFKFQKKENVGKIFSKFEIIILKILREIDIGVPLMTFILFFVPFCVFSSLNLKYVSSTSQTLFTASTFFSVFLLICSLCIIGLMSFYIIKLFINTKRYISTEIELYCLGKYHNNMTLHHFPKNVARINRTSTDNTYFPMFGPYNLHFLNFINERSNDQFNLEELYKHITDQKEYQQHKR